MPDACVLDSSALLSLLHREPGHQVVSERLQSAIMSTVNWAEVAQKRVARGVQISDLGGLVAALGLDLVPFTQIHADVSAQIWPATRSLRLSLGDRACLALGLVQALPVLTADRAWLRLSIGVQVECIRE